MKNNILQTKDNFSKSKNFNLFKTKKTKYGIIIIHGIIGSELFLKKNNKFIKIWPPTDIKAFPFSPIDKIKLLYLDKNGNSINNIVTSKNISEKKTNLGANNAYSKIVKYFKNNYGDENVVFYNYDWRLSCSYNANEFLKFLQGFSENFEEIYILAHSMGGLIASYTLKQLNDKKFKLITLGSPFLGAPVMLAMMISDNIYSKNLVIDILNIDAYFYKDLLINMPSSYDVLPSEIYNYNYFMYILKNNNEKIKEYFLDKKQLDYFIQDNFNTKLFTQSKNFHKNLEITDFHKRNDICSIVGHNLKTPDKIIYFKEVNKKSNKTEVNDDCIVKQNSAGDGTVPIISSTINNNISRNNIYYIKEKHGNLINNEEIFHFIDKKIENWNHNSI